MFYTGIGSRQTPIEICNWFSILATYLSNHSYILRSGHAEGADINFEIGCDLVEGKKEIYLPWKNFNNSNSKLILNNPEAYKIAEKFHPYWHNLSNGAKKLQARNSHQVLGLDLKTPSKFVICWTKNGKGDGGTGQALRIAKFYNIPIFDAGKYSDIESIKINCKEFIQKFL